MFSEMEMIEIDSMFVKCLEKLLIYATVNMDMSW